MSNDAVFVKHQYVQRLCMATDDSNSQSQYVKCHARYIHTGTGKI